MSQQTESEQVAHFMDEFRAELGARHFTTFKELANWLYYKSLDAKAALKEV